MNAVHVAIIEARFAEPLLCGRKLIESRFARRRRPPFGRVLPGDQIYFKASGGEIIGRSLVTRVREFDDLTPPKVDALRRRYNRAILAPRPYWQARRDCRYGILIWLAEFTRDTVSPEIPRQYGSGWLSLSRMGSATASCRLSPPPSPRRHRGRPVSAAHSSGGTSAPANRTRKK